MNNDVFRLVQQSVEEHSMTDDERLLEALRITRDKELPPMHFLFRIFGKPCFPRGELVAVTGKAKSGKTLFNSLLMACCANSQALQVQRNPPEAADTGATPEVDPIRVLWFDTEQSEQSTQDILRNRLTRMIEEGPLREKSYKIDTKSDDEQANADFQLSTLRSAPCDASRLKRSTSGRFDTSKNYSTLSARACSLDPSRTLHSKLNYFDIFNVRSLHYEERMRLFLTAVRKYRPQLVVLDGVRDLLADINDGIRAQEVVEELMKLAQETDCCLVCVLHQNKGAEDRNPRGWIGTELMNKAFEVYACEKLKPENIFMVEQTHTRKYDLGDLMFFRMDPETELPVACEAPARMAVASATAAEQQGSPLPHMNREYLTFDENNHPHPKMDELFYEALKAGPLYYSDLQMRVQELLNCGSSMWNNMFCTMRNRGAIVRVINREGKAVWQLPTVAPVKPMQKNLFGLPADLEGVSPTP